MPYTTAAIIRVESPFKDSTNIDDTYVNRAIAQADSLINSYIGSRYTLPLDSTPSIIQDLSTQLAIYFLFTDQNTNIEIASGVDVTDGMDLAMQTLKAIKKGELQVFDSSDVELALRTTAKPMGYPTATSTAAEDTPAIFEIDKKF